MIVSVAAVLLLYSCVLPMLQEGKENEAWQSDVVQMYEQPVETISSEILPKPSSEYSVEYSADSTSMQEAETSTAPESSEIQQNGYRFRSKKLLSQHYEKHGIEMGFDSAVAYQEAASAVISNPDALYKTEKEDGDGVYYIEETNEFVILSVDGYIRTYFNPSGGIDYFNRQ
ncbi:MAG: hypothetical protein J6M66_13005 [Lachnospiraceae bacterium]|nr:hypothetical protein [Lachnospiraceae bacterium]